MLSTHEGYVQVMENGPRSSVSCYSVMNLDKCLKSCVFIVSETHCYTPTETAVV